MFKVIAAIALLLAQAVQPQTQENPFLAPHEVVITADAIAGKTVVFMPDSGYGNNFDARCVIVYPREGSLAWLIDRKENTAELIYAGAPTPAFCDESKLRKKKK